jgi:diguanylate cyclase (GGDEF)-like protein/PAS domain S-box-containing protein
MVEQRLLQLRDRIPALEEMSLNERRATLEDLIRENAQLRQALGERAEKLNSLQALIEQVPDFLFAKDLDSRFVIANGSIGAGYGRPNAGDLLGLTDFDLHPSEVAQHFFDIEQKIIRTGQSMIDMEELIVSPAGVRKWLSTTKAPLLNEQNKIVGLVGVGRDITARKYAEDFRNGQTKILEMVATNAKLESVLDRLVHLIESQLPGVYGSILLIDKLGRHLMHGVAPSLPEAYLHAIDGLKIGPKAGSCGTAAFRRETVVVADIMNDPLWEDYWALAAKEGYRSCWSTPILSHLGDVLGTFAMYSKEVREPNTNEVRIVDAARRIAGIAIERKRAEERIQFLASHDALTELPNRTLLQDRLAQAVLYAQRYERWVTVAFIDLDNFKFINDSVGHSGGDELLKIVSNRMLSSVRATDTVVRLGGDEFVILLVDQPKSEDLISSTLQKIRAAIAEPIQIGGHDLRVTCSIGLANYPRDGVDADTLLANADAAMYRAKENGRDNFQFYTRELNIKVHEKFVLQKDLRNAVAQSEFVLDYQPQVDLATGRIFAVEALIRWMHPLRGRVPPLEFIPMAEETGLIVQIGDWVLQTACRQNKAWQDEGLAPMTVCVNVSARQFREKSWVSRVASALQESGLEAKYLELELTESLIMQDVEQAIATMEEFRILGVQLSIDDFGTGYSSLAALKRFPVARLKIDKSFIDDLPHDEDGKAVARAIISLGHNLNLRVVAEGVETQAQADFLRANNCDEMQGYYVGKPIAASEINKLLSLSARIRSASA